MTPRDDGTRLHDPSAIRVGDSLYAFSTGFEQDAANPTGAVTVHRTSSRTGHDGWRRIGNVWNSVPPWIPARLGSTPPNFWAPCIAFFEGSYHLYYAASIWGQNASAVMGLLTADDIEGPWIDRGMVTDLDYPIDPSVVTAQDGSLYLAWGSFPGVFLHALDPATGMLLDPDIPPVKLATDIEAATITYHEGYYYLLGSRGSCCDGVNSTYHTVAGRSRSVRGPYLDRSGTPMMSGGGTTVLTGFGSQVAAGGGEFFDNGGELHFAYHYYDADSAGRETLNIRPVSFSEGWPVMGDPV